MKTISGVSFFLVILVVSSLVIGQTNNVSITRIFPVVQFPCGASEEIFFKAEAEGIDLKFEWLLDPADGSRGQLGEPTNDFAVMYIPPEAKKCQPGQVSISVNVFDKDGTPFGEGRSVLHIKPATTPTPCADESTMTLVVQPENGEEIKHTYQRGITSLPNGIELTVKDGENVTIEVGYDNPCKHEIEIEWKDHTLGVPPWDSSPPKKRSYRPNKSKAPDPAFLIIIVHDKALNKTLLEEVIYMTIN